MHPTFGCGQAQIHPQTSTNWDIVPLLAQVEIYFFTRKNASFRAI
jgi:hypothetical protein